MRLTQRGFTLIELMIVVAIVGSLAATAIPQYQDYIVRSKLSAAAVSVSALETACAEYFQTNGIFPSSADLTADGISIVNRANEAIVITGGSTGIIAVTFAAALGVDAPANSQLVFTANASVGDSAIKWVATQTGMVVGSNAANFVATKMNGS